MDCAKAKEYLHPYIDKALPAPYRRELEQHMQNCPDCASELEQLYALSRALRSLPPAELPPGFTQALHEKLAAEPALVWPRLMRRGWVRAVTAAAMLALVIGLISILGNTIRSMNEPRGSELSSTPMAAPAPESPLSYNTNSGSPGSSYLVQEAIMPEDEAYYSDSGADIAFSLAELSESEMPAPEAVAIRPEAMPTALTDTYDSLTDNQSALARTGGEAFGASGSGAAEARLERKIIRDASLSLKVDDFSAAYQSLNELAPRFGGYVVSGDAFSYDGEKMQRGNITLRVEANRLEEALTEIESLGKVENRNIYSQDITLEYYDIAGRLSQYQAQEQRLLDILQKAETVEDLVAVEHELTRVRAQLESLNGQLRYYNQMTALSSINVNLYQPDVNTQKVRLGGLAGFWQDIAGGFISGVNWLIRGVTSLVVGFARLLPLLLLIALVVVVVFVLIKRRQRK